MRDCDEVAICSIWGGICASDKAVVCSPGSANGVLYARSIFTSLAVCLSALMGVETCDTASDADCNPGYPCIA